VSEGIWPIVALGELIESIEAGSSFRCRETPPEQGEVGVAKVSAVSWGRYDEQESKTCLDPSRINKDLLIRKGDFLISRANTVELVGACVIAEQVRKQVMLSDKTLRIVFKDPSLKPWVLHFLRSRAGRQQIEALCTGNQESMRNISQRSLRQIGLPLAPPDEREEILAFIEEQLSRAGATSKTLQAIQAKLKQARASILKAAVEGRLVENEADLTPTENMSCATGVELLEAIRGSHSEFIAGVLGKSTKKRTQSKASETTQHHATEQLPPGWAIAKWEEIGACINGRNFPSSEYQTTGVKLLRPGNLGPDGKTTWPPSKTKCLPQRFADENPMQCLANGDIVMNLTAQSLKDDFLGRACIVNTTEPCLLNQRIARLVPNMILKPYALMVFMSPQFRTFVKTLNTGSLIQHMFTKDINCFYFPIPSILEQQRIAQEVDRRFSVLDKVETTVNDSLRRCGQLRQAVLKRMFGG
jgi:type I restriction enzyme S subunit